MKATTVVLTREELYELVWAEPMTKVAAKYGISDVALRKRCVKADIPTPGLGYWAKLAAGYKVRRDTLPKLRPGVPANVTIGVFPVRSHPVVASTEPVPEVAVPSKLQGLHPAIESARQALKNEPMDRQGRYGTEYSWFPFHVSENGSRRMLLLLEGLARVLVSRGHPVTYEKLAPEDKHCDLVFRVHDAPLGVGVEEKVTKAPYEWTREDKERQKRWGSPPSKKWEYIPNGRLEIRLRNKHWGFIGPSWHDSKVPLEDRLGQIVLEIEAAADLAHARRKAYEAELAEKKRQELAWMRSRRMPIYEKWVVENLEDMVARWKRAQGIRAFMDAYENVLPAEDDVARRYLDGVRAYADRMDPLTSGEEIAKTLSPSDERLEEVEKMVNRATRGW